MESSWKWWRAFLGVVIAMGIVNLPEIRNYWSTSDLCQVPWFLAVITLNRFEMISRYIHLYDNTKVPPSDSPDYKLYKLGNIDKFLTNVFKAIYIPARDLSIDEQMISTKSRINFIQYMPKKPKKIGIKIWALCESVSGYCLLFQIYTGKINNKSEKGLGLWVVLNLMSPYFERHHHLYFDNFYTSPKLLLELEKHKTYACGTVRSNRGQFPTKLMDNIEVGDSVFIQLGNLLTWCRCLQYMTMVLLRFNVNVGINLLNQTGSLPTINSWEELTSEINT